MKLIKDHSNYHLVDDEQFIIGTTDESMLSCTTKHKLSIKNCEAVFNGYDLDELALEETRKFLGYDVPENKMMFITHNKMFHKGFQKALEILDDKKFSVENVKLAIEYGIQSVLQSVPGVTSTQSVLDNYTQSLQQTEWDVEIEMEKHQVKIYIEPDKVEQYKLKPKELQHPWTSNPDDIWEYKPKLDADGCLILKRKV